MLSHELFQILPCISTPNTCSNTASFTAKKICTSVTAPGFYLDGQVVKTCATVSDSSARTCDAGGASGIQSVTCNTGFRKSGSADGNNLGCKRDSCTLHCGYDSQGGAVLRCGCNGDARATCSLPSGGGADSRTCTCDNGYEGTTEGILDSEIFAGCYPCSQGGSGSGDGTGTGGKSSGDVTGGSGSLLVFARYLANA